MARVKAASRKAGVMKLTNGLCLTYLSSLMLAFSLCEAAEKELPLSKDVKSSQSNAAKRYGANLNEAESLRALEAEISRKLGSNIRASDYPEEARRQGWSGTSLVAVLVGRNGEIKEVSIHRTSGFPILDQQAVRMVERVNIWWIPQRLRKREVKVTVPVGFYIRSTSAHPKSEE